MLLTRWMWNCFVPLYILSWYCALACRSVELLFSALFWRYQMLWCSSDWRLPSSSSSGEWTIPQQQRLKYKQIFNSHDPTHKGFLTGKHFMCFLIYYLSLSSSECSIGLRNSVLWYICLVKLTFHTHLGNCPALGKIAKSLTFGGFHVLTLGLKWFWHFTWKPVINTYLYFTYYVIGWLVVLWYHVQIMLSIIVTSHCTCFWIGLWTVVNCNCRIHKRGSLI